MPENQIDYVIDSIESAESDAGLNVHITEYPTVGQQIVTALISVAVPVVAGFGIMGAIAVGTHIRDSHRARKALRRASSLETVEPTPSDTKSPTETE